MRMPHKCGLGARVRMKDGTEGVVKSISTFQNKTGGWKMEVLPDNVKDTGWAEKFAGYEASRIAVYDDEVEILDIGKPTNGAMVHWAPYGQHIPLTCQKCGASFSTKNIAEGRSLFHGWSLDGEQEARKCDDDGHSYNDLKPNQELYELRYPQQTV